MSTDLTKELLSDGDLNYLVKSPPKKGKRVTDPIEAQAQYANIKRHLMSRDCKEQSEICITLKAQLHALNIHFVRAYIVAIIESITDKVQMNLFYEISPRGKMHYHGLFSGIGNDTIRSISKALQRRIGRIEIKHILKYESYIDYILKRYTKEFSKYDRGINEHYDISIIPKNII